MLLEQRAALTFGHPAPDAEFDPVVQGVGATLGDHRTVATNHGRFTLRGAPNEQLVGIRRTAQSLGNPGNPRFPVHPLKWALNWC